MRFSPPRFSPRLFCLFMLALLSLTTGSQAFGVTESILWNFGDGTDGAQPLHGGLLRDSSGDLYGTTSVGGSAGVGTVFELKPSSGSCTPPTGQNSCESILWNFGVETHDGRGPVAGLIMDGSGNLYGTTSAGGTSPSGDGTVFELSPPSSSCTPPAG